LGTITATTATSIAAVERFATDAVIQALDARIAGGAALATDWAELAWHLRQRDTRRALQAADTAQSAAEADATVDASALAARLDLVRAEASWLRADLATADVIAQRALQAFAQAGDEIGMADAHWLVLNIATDQGDPVRRQVALAASLAHAQAAGDASRIALAETAQHCFECFADPRGSMRWNDVIDRRIREGDAALRALAHHFRSVQAAQLGDHAGAIDHALHTADDALETGQLRRAIMALTNASSILCDLNDLEGALQYAAQALKIAQRNEGPQAVGTCLCENAELLLKLGHTQAAAAMIDDALAVMQPLAHSSSHANALGVQGAVLLALSQPAQAGAAFAAMEQVARAINEPALLVDALRGRVQALADAGRREEGLAVAAELLPLVQDDGLARAQSQMLLARLDDAQALHHLTQALQAARQVDGLTMMPELPIALAREHARRGDHEQAYAFAVEALALHERIRNRRIAQRVIAMEVRHRTDQARAEAARQRAAAQQQAVRADALEATQQALRAAQAELIARNDELQQAYRAMQEQSLTDPLTGMRNRRFLLQQIESDIALCLRRYDEVLEQTRTLRPESADVCFFMVDVDGFKQVNDRFGHHGGDLVLMQMRDRLGALFRESDYLIRWGGEEFLVVARETDRAQASLMAERIRRAIEEAPFVLEHGREVALTCSVGFASFPFITRDPRSVTWSQVIEWSDQALNLAKQSGRNGWVGVCAGSAMRAAVRVRSAEELAHAAAQQEIVVDSSLPAARSRFAADADVGAQRKS
jgi:diguanylate cyclase (GGDEF)-like protein